MGSVLGRLPSTADFAWWLSKSLAFRRRPLRMRGDGALIRLKVDRRLARAIERQAVASCCSVSDLCAWLVWEIFLPDQMPPNRA